MKKVIIILSSIVLLVILVKCIFKVSIISSNCIYRGESENWTAECNETSTNIFYEAKGITHYFGNSSGELTITYKNDVSQSPKVKDLEISYKDNSGSGSIHETFDDESQIRKNYKFTNVGDAVPNKDEIIKVNINI